MNVGPRLLLKIIMHLFHQDDYITWPSSNQNNISCVLGQQLTHQRRKRHANCYGGENFDTSISIVPCSCDFRDYLW